jgi:hypothetical protein
MVNIKICITFQNFIQRDFFIRWMEDSLQLSDCMTSGQKECV